MATCAYCGQTGKVTREEVMPLFLSRSRPTYRTVLDRERRLVGAGIVAPVRDVCEDCNNGALSSLDAYVAKPDREYFTGKVQFFVMPDSDAEDLFREMVKFSQEDRNRQFVGRTIALPPESFKPTGP